MPAWNAKLRTLRPFKAFNDKFRLLRNTILASSCIPQSNGPNNFDDEQKRPLREDIVAGRQSAETQMEERSPDLALDRTTSRFNERQGFSSWLGVVPYRPATHSDDSEHNRDPSSNNGEHHYHYRLRRVHLMDDQDDEELEDPPFITPIPSVKIDTPAAPRKSEGSYSRYYAMFDRSLVSASFDDLLQLPLEGVPERGHLPKRYPKLEVIFGQQGQDSVDLSTTEVRRNLFNSDVARSGSGSTGSKYKYMEEVERDPGEVFLNAGIDHSVSRFLETSVASRTRGSSGHSRRIDSPQMYTHDNESILDLPSIDSDAATVDIQSQPRSEPFAEPPQFLSSSGSSASRALEDEDAQPISVSISKVDSALFSYRPSSKLPATPSTPPTESRKSELRVGKTHESQEVDQQPGVVNAEEYSFIAFATPSRISLAIPSTLPSPTRSATVVPAHVQSELVARSKAVAEDVRRVRSHILNTAKSGALVNGGKKVRIAENPEIYAAVDRKSPLPRANAAHSGICEGLPTLIQAVSADFARDLNQALEALDRDRDHVEIVSALSSNAADKGALKGKIGMEHHVQFEDVLPPSALLSPASRFSEGEATLNDPEPAFTPPSRRRRKFALGGTGKQASATIGVPLTRTKTRDHHRRNRQQPLVYRKLLALYSMQYSSL